MPSSEADALKRRKLIALRSWKTYHIDKGAKFARERRKAATDLTFDMLKQCALQSPLPSVSS